MKKILWMIVLAVLMTACGAADGQTLQATPRAAAYGAANAVTPETVRVTTTPTPDELATAYAVIAFDEATSTARAAETSTAIASMATQEAKATAQFWVGVTLQVATQQALATQQVGTQSAGTQQAAAQTAAPQTATALKSTQIVESNDLNSKVASLWIWRVGFAVFFAGLMVVFVIVLYRGIPIATEFGKELGEAKVMKEKTDALKGADRVPSSVLKKDEKLIIPDMAHRVAIDPHHDDLTTAQALENTKGFRELQITKSIAQSPLMAKFMARDLHKQGMPPFSVKVTKPESQGVPQPEHALLPEREILPALPAPALPLLFSKWDGALLPFGADEDGKLMRVDPAIRAHFMVVGRSRSGKTLSSIRPMVACLLTMGWNVVVMGKRVDFMPFEEHPNFKLIAVDVRKDARKYINTLKVLTDQMDIRDRLLASKGVSTWDRYGAAPTMAVIDDYSGVMLRMPKKEAGEVLNEVKSIAFDGAKYGLHLTLGLQRATWENIDTNLRSQMGRIVYSLESAGDSRVALGEDGAERLPLQFNFLTRMTDDSAVRRGVGFTLQDVEIEAFLQSRPVAQNEPLEWIDATSETVEEEDETRASVTPETFSASPADTSAAPEDDFRSRILSVYLGKLSLQRRFSLRDIEREVFGFTGGKAHDTVKRVIAETELCDVSQVSAVLNEMFSKWNLATTDGATTVLFGGNDENQPDIAVVAG